MKRILHILAANPLTLCGAVLEIPSPRRSTLTAGTASHRAVRLRDNLPI